MTNNSHPVPEAHDSPRNNKADRQGAKDEIGGEAEAGSSAGGGGASSSEKEEKASHMKDKSVLQAKLTKLAIQIGYAGMQFNFPQIAACGQCAASRFVSLLQVQLSPF